ncbi:hypothetical protein ACOKS3_09295 [Pseudomonas sp. HS6-2]|uniref:hypothetical protein n=1 Tax=Pseudomonas sp. HS6-2 TaxID=3410986 RepID=UPI003BCF543A
MTFLVILASVAVAFVAFAFYASNSVMAETSNALKVRIRLVFVVSALLLILLWGWLYVWKNSPQRELEAQAKDCGNTTMAFVMSQNFVKQGLKSPASAKFPYVNDRGVDVTADGKCGFSVLAYVDSQNGFGAIVRSSYLAKISYSRETKRWSLSELTIQ